MEAEGGSDKMSNFNDTDSEEDELQSHSTKLDTQLAQKMRKMLSKKNPKAVMTKRKPLKLKQHKAGKLDVKNDDNGTTLLFKTSQA